MRHTLQRLKGVSLLAPCLGFRLDPQPLGLSTPMLCSAGTALAPHPVFPSRPEVCRAESLCSSLEILHPQLSSAPAQG